MKRIAQFCLAVTLLVGTARAGDITVNWSAESAALANSNDTAANQGSLLMLGTFTPGFDIAANQNNLLALQANFIQFTTGSVGDGYNLNGVWSTTSTAAEDNVATQKIYLWTFNSIDVASATQQGIFSSTATDWLFPSSSDVPNSTTIDLSQVDEILVGAAGVGTINITTGVDLPFVKMAAAAFAVPAAPSGLTATAVSTSQINLAWTDNATNETTYKIERAPSSGGPWNEIATTNANVVAYANTGLDCATPYYYRVRAANANGNSAYSSSATDITSACNPPTDITPPSLLVTFPADFQAFTNANLTVTGTASDTSGIQGVTVNGAAATLVITNWTRNVTLAAGTNTFVVIATDNSIALNTTTQTVHAVLLPADFTPPTAPADLVAGAADCHGVQLSWTGSTDSGGSGLAGYRVYRDATPIADVTQTSYQDTTATPGNQHCYTVAARDNVGNESTATTSACATVPLCPDPTAGAFTGLALATNAAPCSVNGSVTINATATGSFTGTLVFGGVSFAGSGQFNANGLWSGFFGALPASLRLEGADLITGNVNNAGATAGIRANRALFSKTNPATPWARNYTMAFISDVTGPAGIGYANVTVDTAGRIKLKGVLGDGTKIKQKGSIGKDGTWPLYVPLATNRGLLAGWITITNTPVVVDSEVLPADMSGAPRWCKPAIPTDVFYPAGFSAVVSALGSVYVMPPAGTRVITASNTTCNVVFEIGENPVSATLDTANIVTPCDPGTLTWKLKTKTGSFSGAYTSTNSAPRVSFTGLILPTANVGVGFSKGTTTTDFVVIHSAE